MNAAQRLTALPLPAYRYIPGRGPKDEKRRDIPSIKTENLSPDRWRKNEPYLYGVDLFHQGFYYEAHEVWEALWHKVGHRTIPGQFLKALIQMAAVQLKLLSGDLKTAGKMTLRVRDLLEQVLASIHPEKVFMGLPLAALLKKLPKPGASPKPAPRLELKF